jgi:predicted enzyme related to lactoylglutathione lyase
VIGDSHPIGTQPIRRSRSDGPGPTLFLQEVREGKTSKNRVHSDIEVSDGNAQVERLTAQGATVISQLDTWTVLQDPEGNEFCLSDQR